ncbi:LOW QUALITY PROTEIN: hypothetical protein U9M48_004947 [Paspalum notatum var. saurae]|uniref:Reverse transcriptase domain-containing protein n=1 Tax=Paspalum notatum var. saurae TaxID=547442 RepID=A0AAQ3SF56_PASNO
MEVVSWLGYLGRFPELIVSLAYFLLLFHRMNWRDGLADELAGPDGFRPAFYRAFWSLVKPHQVSLFDAFHAGPLDLEAVNRAPLVLIPKKMGANSADAFRPISLQNCPMKLLTNVLANRLREVIPNLVDQDQSGFVHGHTLAEKFVYAADLLSCCHKRRAHTVVLKLDFKKAFDSVDLLVILSARGFDDRWCRRISSVLTSGKTAVLLTGVLGRWINCRRGLRKGDPISPFHFIIVADVLHRLIQLSCDAGDLYADDTLILLKRNVRNITTVKLVLDHFSVVTRLSIDFHKSTFVPLHIDTPVARDMACVLGCSISSFCPPPH